MSQIYCVYYTKPGAVFTDGNQAAADKSSLYGEVLTKQVEDCYNKMLANGILLEPEQYIWNQEKSMITTVRKIISFGKYQDAITYDINQALRRAHEAGWTLMGTKLE